MLTFFVYVLVDVTWYLVLPLAAPFIGYRLARKKFGLSGIKAAGIALAVFLCLMGCNYYSLLIWNPLPSDEEMIANFKAHRADFVEAVRRYREYPADNTPWDWYKEGDTLELFNRAGIDNIAHGFGVWYPDPYAVATAVRRERKRRELPPFAAFDKYGDLRIQPATTPRIEHPDRSDTSRHYRGSLLFGVIWKEYYFFPEVPRIENGILLGPLQTTYREEHGAVFHEKEGVATIHQFTARVLPTLNRLPRKWQDYECVYRRIESQWFIGMCNGH